MSDVVIELLPVMVVAVVVPIYPIMVLLLLQSSVGVGKAIAFVTGGLMIRLAQGVLFGLVFSEAIAQNGEGGQQLIASTLLMVVGILLLVLAFRMWRKEEDPDGLSPQWMTGINDLSALRALGMGALIVAIDVKQWVFTLSAIGIIAAAGLGQSTAVALYLFYILITQILVLSPILFYALARERAAKPMQTAERWLERHNRVIVITVSLIFGLWFSYKGITGLINETVYS